MFDLMKSAGLYQGEKNYIVHSQSTTKDGFDIATEPYFVLDINISIFEVTSKILEALNASQIGVENPKNWQEFTNNYIKKIGLKKHSDLYKGFLYCNVQLDDNLIEFIPSINKGLREGFTPMNENKTGIAVNAKIEAISEKLKNAIEKCR